jgi:N-carbamoyl-L-amino-acid hydrolase
VHGGNGEGRTGIVTAVPGVCEISLDQRALDATVLARMLTEARDAAAAAANNNVLVEWKRVWQIEPRPFDAALIALCDEAVREVTGDAPQLPSARCTTPRRWCRTCRSCMMFAYSSNGLSHCKEEDTPGPHLEKTIEAFLKLFEKTVSSSKESHEGTKATKYF